MADDLALLGVVIEERGVDPTIRKLDTLAESGANAERATQGLSRAQADLVARSQALADAAGVVNVRSADATAKIVTQASEVRALAEQMGGLAAADENAAAAIQTLNTRTRESAAAMAAVQGVQAPATAATATVTKETVALGTASGVTRAGLNSVRSSLTSMAAAMLGTAPGVAQLTGVLGTMALGSGVMVGVLAGIAAVTAGYEYLTRKSREASEAADAFSKTDISFAARARAIADVQQQLAGNPSSLKIDTVGATKQIDDLMKAVRGFNDELASSETRNIGGARFGGFNQELLRLRNGLAAGTISEQQFAEGMHALERAFPDYAPQIAKTAALAENYKAATAELNRLVAAQKNAQAEGRATVAAFGQPGTSFEQGGDAAVKLAEQRRALADAQTRAAAASSRGTFGVEDIDSQRQALEQATESWKQYVVATGDAALANTSYAQALSNHNAAAVEFLRNAQAQITANQQVARTLQLQAEVTRGTGEIDKLHALNAAYRESALAQQLLGIQLDATSQKRQNKLQYQDADLAKVNALVDATARERAQQVLLNDQLDREAKLRASRNENAGALEAAVHARDTAGLPRADAEIQQIRDRAQEEIDQAQRAHDALRGLTRQQQADEDRMLAERIANVHAVTAAQIEGIQRAREEATKESVNTQVRDTDAETAGIRAQMEAEMQGAGAVEAMRVQLAGEDAVRRAVNDATARGTVLTNEQAGALRASAEEYERARVQAEKYQTIQRETSSVVGGIVSDVVNAKNPLPRLKEYVKEQFIAGVTEALARPISVRIAKIFGIEQPASEQAKAGRDMLTAGQIIDGAADKIIRGVGGVPSGTTGVPGDGDVSTQQYAGQFVQPTPPWQQRAGETPPIVPHDPRIHGASVLDTIEAKLPDFLQRTVETIKVAAKPAIAGAVAGYATGESLYSTSHGTFGNYARGAVGGALTGAAAGFAVAGPVGAAVGAVAGFVSGIVGVSHASKEAEKATRELRTALEENMASLRATVNHDDLGAAIAQVDTQREQLRKQIEDAYSGGGANSDTVRERNKQLAEMNALEDKRIQQLKEEAAAMSRYFTEDLKVRELRAKGQNAAADALDFQDKQERERDEYRRTHDMTKQENIDQYNYLLYVQSLEKNTSALEALTTSVNTVTGFKLADLNPYIQEFSQGRPYPGQMQVPVNPFVPPTSPLSQPALSRTGTVATQPLAITIATGAIVVNESKTPQLTAEAVTRMVLTKIDEERNAHSGLSSSRAAALERIKLPPGGIPWRS